MKKFLQTNRKTGDLSIALIVAVLVIFGTIMIFSASYYPSGTNNYNPYYFLKRQLVWLVASTAAMWFCAKVDYHFWARLWIIVPVICAILLVLVLLILLILVLLVLLLILILLLVLVLIVLVVHEVSPRFRDYY